MDLEEDIGVMVRHNYTLHNKGPWTVRNVTAIVRPITQLAFLRAVVMFGDFLKVCWSASFQFEWPYQIESTRQKGKWALYLLDVPTVTMHNTDGTTDIRRWEDS